MKKIIVYLILSVTSIVLIKDLKAQYTILASGENAIGFGGSSNYSIGQIFYSNFLSNSLSIEEGVQHPFEIFTSTKESEKQIIFQLEAYPNPTKSRLTLRVDLFVYQKLDYTLYDLRGKVLEKNKILKTNTYIEFNELPVSTYFLKVSNENRLLKTFRILKK